MAFKKTYLVYFGFVFRNKSPEFLKNEKKIKEILKKIIKKFNTCPKIYGLNKLTNSIIYFVFLKLFKNNYLDKPDGCFADSSGNILST